MAGAAPVLDEAGVALYRLELQDRERSTPEPLAGDDREWIEPLLQQNAVWFCQLRWIAIAVLGIAGLASFFPQRLEYFGLNSSPAWPLTAAFVLAALNIAFVELGRAELRQGRMPVRAILWAQIVSDLLVLTGVIHWLGHPLPAAPFMYLFHIILACIVFTPRESLGVAGLAAAFYLSSLVLESAGLLEHSSVLRSGNLGAGDTAAFSVLSMFLVWTVIWYLSSRLASALRSRDRELFISNRRLRASIEERSQHMLQTTHQLKAPFAAIHAQSQLLLGDYCGILPSSARATVEKISARCVVLARQIQEMLQLANLRSHGQTPPPKRSIDLSQLIEEVITRIEPAARQRGVRFETALQPARVEAVEDHLTMLIDNLVVNAVNYSYANGVVNVTCLGRRSGDISTDRARPRHWDCQREAAADF